MNPVSVNNLFVCPDDRTPLVADCRNLRCPDCDRIFPVYDGKLVELLPSEPSSVAANSAYVQDYHTEFHRAFHFNSSAVAWGAPESYKAQWVRRRTREVEFVGELLAATDRGVLCDISAGAGYYTRAYAGLFDVALHCDLSVDNLSYNLARIEKGKHDNIVFVRADYFRLPLRYCVNRLLCFDTLIQGPEHEVALLTSIYRALSPSGFAVVDFHNWYHNPLRRLGLLPENFTPGSYGQRAAANLILNAGARKPDYFPFRQEFEPASMVGRILGTLIPPTRHVFRVSSARNDCNVYASE